MKNILNDNFLMFSIFGTFMFDHHCVSSNFSFYTEELEEDIESNDLQAMFETTFRRDIRQRLQRDEDYQPLRHPNSEDYFVKDLDSKQNKKE